MSDSHVIPEAAVEAAAELWPGGADFDAKREAYEAALAEYFDLIDTPRTYVPGGEYRRELDAALDKQQRTHKAMMAAW